jgi:hypothetical protein
LQVRGQMRQNALADAGIAEKQAQIDEQARARQLLGSPGFDPSSAAHQNALLAAAPTVGAQILTSQAKFRQDQAAANKSNADADATRATAQRAAWGQNLQQLGAVNDPQSFQAWAAQSVKDGHLPMQMAQGIMQEAQQNPQALPQLKQRLLMTGMDAMKQLDMQAAKPVEVSLGGSKVFRDTNSYSPTFNQNIGPTMNVTQSPDNAATNKAHIQGIGMQQAGENARAGMMPGGQMDANFEATAKAIANGQMPPPSGMALTNPRNQRLLGRVMEINPQYDFTDVTAKKQAAAAFTSGKEGAAMRSFAVAGQHLDQLGQLADALDNGNLQLVNKVSQAIEAQTGNPAPTNFDAAKQIVAKEVVKAIVAGGGGVDERKALEETLSRAKSPAQLKGVITQYRGLMDAQHSALLQQRRAAGLRDDTLPDYTHEAAAAKPDIHSQAEAILRGGK